MEEPRRALLFQQHQHKSPRLPPARQGDGDHQSLGDGRNAGQSGLGISTFFRPNSESVESGAKANPSSAAGSPSTQMRGLSELPAAEGARFGHNHESVMPVLECTEAQQKEPQLSVITAESQKASPVAGLDCGGTAGKLKASSIVHERIENSDHPATRHDLAYPAQLVIGSVEHPKELSPQSVPQKKAPLNPEDRNVVHNEVRHPHGGSGNSRKTSAASMEQLTGARDPCRLMPVCTDGLLTTEALAPHGDASCHAQQVHDRQINEATAAKEDMCQKVSDAAERRLSAYSEEELLEGESNNLKEPDGQSEHPSEYTQQLRHVKPGRHVHRIKAAVEEGRILRAKTIAVSPSGLPKAAPFIKETNFIEKRTPNIAKLSSEAARGTPR